MSVEKLERVLWRLRKDHPGTTPTVSRKALRRAIMFECGTDPKTFQSNKQALVHLDWLSPSDDWQSFRLTDRDLTEA